MYPLNLVVDFETINSISIQSQGGSFAVSINSLQPLQHAFFAVLLMQIPAHQVLF